LQSLGHDLTRIRGDRDALPSDLNAFDAVISYGGPHAFDEAQYVRDEVAWAKRWVAADKPWIGFCLGSQILAHALGAEVGPRADGLHEIGSAG
jgi:GMP synthase (glutamine-hydrolysing)